MRMRKSNFNLKYFKNQKLYPEFVNLFKRKMKRFIYIKKQKQMQIFIFQNVSELKFDLRMRMTPSGYGN